MSDRFAAAAADVLTANGVVCAVSDGPLPTQAVSYLTASKFGLGVMITASHNPYFYNGVKIKQNGRSAPPSITAELENYISKAVPMRGAVPPRPADLSRRTMWITWAPSPRSARSFQSFPGRWWWISCTAPGQRWLMRCSIPRILSGFARLRTRCSAALPRNRWRNTSLSSWRP